MAKLTTAQRKGLEILAEHGPLVTNPIRLADYGLNVFDTGIPVTESWLLKPGEAVVIKPGALSLYSRAEIVAHPLAIVWMTYERDGADVVAQKSQEWIAQRIEDMAEAALRRIEAPTRTERNWEQIDQMRAKPIGIIADGPMAGLLAYHGYSGRVHTRGHYVLVHG